MAGNVVAGHGRFGALRGELGILLDDDVEEKRSVAVGGYRPS